LQYLTPTLQFLLGVAYFHEDMPAGRWIGFALVWVALAIFTLDLVRQRRPGTRMAAEPLSIIE
jgi:chloramphenicol-sensitive protein RarD